jgi:hypothetical protein
MKKTIERVIGPWGNPEKGPRYVRPDSPGALNRFGEILESATGDMATTAIELSVHDVQALGSALRRIAAGEDARHVFAQNKVGHRPGERLRKQTIGRAYYRALAEHLNSGAKETVAKRAAQRAGMAAGSDKPVDVKTIERYAHEHQTAILAYMDDLHRIGSGPSTRKLRAHLQKHGQHMSEGPDLPPLTMPSKKPVRG